MLFVPKGEHSEMETGKALNTFPVKLFNLAFTIRASHRISWIPGSPFAEMEVLTIVGKLEKNAVMYLTTLVATHAAVPWLRIKHLFLPAQTPVLDSVGVGSRLLNSVQEKLQNLYWVYSFMPIGDRWCVFEAKQNIKSGAERTLVTDLKQQNEFIAPLSSLMYLQRFWHSSSGTWLHPRKPRKQIFEQQHPFTLFWSWFLS